MKRVFVCLCLLGLHGSAALAEIYRWTDDNGRLHFTDNLESVSPAYRGRVGGLEHQAPAPVSFVAPPPAPAPPPLPAPATSTSPSLTADDLRGLRQEAAELERQLAAATRERQTYLDHLNAIRPAQTNPAFGRQRRESAKWGYALGAVERQIETLSTKLQAIQHNLRRLEEARQAPAPTAGQAGERHFDQQGHDAAYWQWRRQAIRSRLSRAQQERQAIVARLTPEAEQERRAFGRHGHETLRQSQRLQDLEQEIREGEAALQALRAEALRAGAPATWLQEGAAPHPSPGP